MLSGVKLENFPTGHLVTENQRPILSLGEKIFVASLLPEIYNMFHAKKNFYETCRNFALGIFFLLQRLLNEQDENLTKKNLRAKIELLNVILSIAQSFFHIQFYNARAALSI